MEPSLIFNHNDLILHLFICLRVMVILLFLCRLFRFCMCFVVLNRETLTINKRKLFAEKYSLTFSLELAFQRTIFLLLFCLSAFSCLKESRRSKTSQAPHEYAQKYESLKRDRSTHHIFRRERVLL